MNQANRNPLDHVPEQLASECLIQLHNSASYPRAEISRLAQLAGSQDPETAKSATTAIFASLVEPLADSFEPAAVGAYNRAFSQFIQHCRESEEGRAFDRELRGFNLLTEDDVVRRAECLRRSSKLTRSGAETKRVILLSRVTLGADVAITSVIFERMKRRFPKAEIVLVGGRKAAELFGGDSRVSFKAVGYQRAGSLTERLTAWLEVLEAARALTEGLGPEEYLIVDPDSRLTQLGLLPVADSSHVKTSSTASVSNYLFFPSREYGASTSHSLAELTSAWLNDLLGEDDTTRPRVHLNGADIEIAGALIRRLRAEGPAVVSINFGVGENPGKSLGKQFENGLVRSLLEEGVRVILDRGAGEDEARRADEVITGIRASKKCVVEIDEDNLRQMLSRDSPDAELLVWSGRIGLLAALIGESDLYIGYDSAGQHIAAALGVPCLDVMAGFSSPRMIDRWRPTGSAETRVIVARDSALEETISQGRQMLRSVSHHL
jgi:ADP-heptose:LPS heptosyltransferase